ncbi:MAG: hypothetical protein UX78_C0014G0005 [Candidatus Amesbacteria bacterium GW2011_GWA2_47_11]|uniref:Uncharacterized protein n=3 Tax=Candidatus Amesiibacteriota TaxID=1752730 RepID=A0A0G1XED5_9BACT|nr:MAG: hypothetical protein UX78_C0014G0005 [Candidatus Amesbacteria bacterium GW2011_GWA2_47_11]KKU92685.1 MAG: hypothetical protein UY22_C0028G0007 [Candidatus Amesbacteria bacterium GW2011_GWC1_48_10]KKU98699.1 MAG: hypothetical protein UY33_C0046G0004 [Candidatus Amesbacteria bacterium GW2011_GWA1_48_9]
MFRRVVNTTGLYLLLTSVWYLLLRIFLSSFSMECLCLPNFNLNSCPYYRKLLLFKVSCECFECVSASAVFHQYLLTLIPPLVLLIIILTIKYFRYLQLSNFYSRLFLFLALWLLGPILAIVMLFISLELFSEQTSAFPAVVSAISLFFIYLICLNFYNRHQLFNVSRKLNILIFTFLFFISPPLFIIYEMFILFFLMGFS